MYRALIWLSLCTLLPVSVSAQAASPQSTAARAAASQAVPSKVLSPQMLSSEDKEVEEQRETIRQLVTEMKELKARLAALEAKQPSAVTSSTIAAPASATDADRNGEIAAAQPALPSTSQTQSQSQSQSPENAPFHMARGIQFQGFGALTYRASDVKPAEAPLIGLKAGSSGNFSVGDVDLFLTSHLSAKMMVLAEVVFTESENQEFETDVERMLLKYDANDYLKMSFGRYHTATSYYNSVFHHGNWLQTAVDRPLVVEFADHGGLLPSQAVGASATGTIPSGALGLNYNLEYGTGATVRPLINQPNPPEIDEENGNHISGGLFIKPDWLPGLDVGGNVYHDRLSPAGTPLHIGQTIGSMHAVYLTPKFEFLGEGFFIQHKVQETNQTFNTPAFYALISHKLGTQWRPYFRYQYVNASSSSPLYADVSLRHGPSAGIRYDFNDYLAIKSQYDRTYRRNLPSFNEVLAQMAFRF
jgi:hypothetical protein